MPIRVGTLTHLSAGTLSTCQCGYTDTSNQFRLDFAQPCERGGAVPQCIRRRLNGANANAHIESETSLYNGDSTPLTQSPIECTRVQRCDGLSSIDSYEPSYTAKQIRQQSRSSTLGSTRVCIHVAWRGTEMSDAVVCTQATVHIPMSTLWWYSAVRQDYRSLARVEPFREHLQLAVERRILVHLTPPEAISCRTQSTHR